MATHQSVSAWFQRSAIIATVLMVLIIGAIGVSLFGQWASLQGGPELAPCTKCQQGPALGSITLDFTGQAA